MLSDEYKQPFKLEGYIDLKNFDDYDEVVIRQYVRILRDGDLVKHAEKVYTGKQELPMVYITPKPSIYGILVTIQRQMEHFRRVLPVEVG
jgi:hypothetical protein